MHQEREIFFIVQTDYNILFKRLERFKHSHSISDEMFEESRSKNEERILV